MARARASTRPPVVVNQSPGRHRADGGGPSVKLRQSSPRFFWQYGTCFGIIATARLAPFLCPTEARAVSHDTDDGAGFTQTESAPSGNRGMEPIEGGWALWEGSDRRGRRD